MAGSCLDVLDLFSAAAGGWSLGLHRAGYRTIAACEAVAWRRALYQQNNPGVPVYDDVCTLTADQLVRDLGRLPAIVVGSPPCQDISSANTKGKGVEGDRSGLYFEAIRIIGEVRPRWFALENSANLRTRGADAVLAALEALGYACWSFVVRAGDIGANHERPRSWLIGCDVEQVSDADGFGRDEGRGRRRGGLDIPVSEDPCDAEEIGQRAGLSRGCAGATAGAEQSSCGDDDKASNASFAVTARRDEVGRWGRWPEGTQGKRPLGSCVREPTRDAAHADQAGQADGCMVAGLRQAEIADDGRSSRRGDDRPGAGQMGVCAADRGDAAGWRADWSLNDLAAHLQLDDGLSAWLADTRIAVGGPRGTSAASLIVEAFGDAVVPQIPEAIGRAILRVEAALTAVFGGSSNA